MIPQRQLLFSNDIWVLASVEILDERGAPNIRAADIESPAAESAVLVGIELDTVADIFGDAVLGNLRSKVSNG